MWNKDYEFQNEKNERIFEMKKELLHDLQKNSADSFFRHFIKFLVEARGSNFETMEKVIWNEFLNFIREIYQID